jgi:hypothetical protein
MLRAAEAKLERHRRGGSGDRAAEESLTLGRLAFASAAKHGGK